MQDPSPQSTPATSGEATGVDDAEAPEIVREEKQLLNIVLRKLDAGSPRKNRIQVDDASALIELRDALAEAKPEDQGSITGANAAPDRGAVAPSAARGTRPPSTANRRTSATCAWKRTASGATC